MMVRDAYAEALAAEARKPASAPADNACEVCGKPAYGRLRVVMRPARVFCLFHMNAAQFAAQSTGVHHTLEPVDPIVLRPQPPEAPKGE